MSILEKIAGVLGLLTVAFGFTVMGYSIHGQITPETIEIEIKGNGITLSASTEKGVITTDEGDIEVDLPNVDSVDNPSDLTCEDEEECGAGAFIPVNTQTPQTVVDSLINKCTNSDHIWGSQCWDLADVIFQNIAGRRLSTCGTHKAKGTWECKDYNAGDEFEAIDYPSKIYAGDILVFGNGEYGHIGMAVGPEKNGFVALLGQNQGGSACEGGGSSANIINISAKNIIGIFRPKIWIKETIPEVIPVTGCVDWNVKRGDTMSGIMLECEKTVVYGEAMDNYAKSWFSTVYKPGQSVYDGWHSKSGVGLYAGDLIEHDVK